MHKAHALVERLSDEAWQSALVEEVKALSCATAKAEREFKMAQEAHNMVVQLAVAGAR